jgi:virginiamycin B lyase
MFRFARILLTAACICAIVTVAVQGRQGGPGRGQQPPLPEGAGKAMVQAMCTSCHNTNLITGSAGYDHEGWKTLVATMVRLPEAQANTLSQYLATNFPATTTRRPTLVAGDATISIREWQVGPTLGQRARDPFQAEDGTIWWTGQFASIIGRLDPRTGETREFKLDPEARPHSAIMGPDGNVWYTGNGNGTMGRLNPETGEVTVYPMPDPEARDPHSHAFDQNGTLWFTLQGSNMMGRMNIETGDIRLVKAPNPNARPYGIQIDSQGTPWVAYRNANAVARIDPKTMEVREYRTTGSTDLTNPASGIRRLAIDSRDMIWFVDSYRGYIGRLDPRTGEVKDWPSPSGPASHPYAIAVVDDVVWYNESRQRPDALVRFDPETETFQSWAIPSGSGIIRHMTVSPEGNLVIHQSSTNTVGIVTIGADDRQTRR